MIAKTIIRNAIAGSLLAMTIVASAWAISPTHVRGTIQSVSAHRLVVATPDGRHLDLRLAHHIAVTLIEPSSVSAIKPGAYIGTAAITQPTGTLKALEIQVFPQSMRGIGEGHHPWDLGTHSTMTNGTIGTVKIANGRTITLTYKGGEQTVFVPPHVPVITYQHATRHALTPGAHVIVFATETARHTLVAHRIGVGKNGLVPPM